MATATADSPPAPASELGPAAEGPEAHHGPVSPPAPVERSCANCGAALAAGQDWCLQCGAGAPGSISTSPNWRSAATILCVAVVLALGAAAAAYAALSKESSKPRTVTMAVAQPTTPTTTTPTTPEATVPTTPSTKTNLPLGTVKPPKIPLTATPTPKSSTTNIPGGNTQGTETPTTTKTTPQSTAGGGEATQPTALLLDTNAAATYNPYNYPESDFGDPSLTIDGDTTTGWTAIVEPASAPKMADGVVIDLKTAHKLSALKLVTSSPGMTVQVYGANGKTAPSSITDPAWVALSHSQVLAKKHVRIKLRDQKKGFTFITLWISQASAASVGTPEAPGHVSVNEIELFPAK